MRKILQTRLKEFWDKCVLKDFLESILDEEITKIEIRNPEIPKNIMIVNLRY